MAEIKVKNRLGRELHNLFTEVFSLHAALSRVMDLVHEQAGLRTPQIRIMGLLKRSGPATVPDVAARLGVSRQFVQMVCNELSSRGYLVFSNNPRHKRSKLAALTPEGRRTLQQTRQKENQMIEQALPQIEPKQAIEARRILMHIREMLETRPISR